jgi:phosphatidylserine decarboxylase
MTDIVYIDRQTGQKQIEKVYKARALKFFYGDSFWGRFVRPWLVPFLTKTPFFSVLYGYLQKRPASARQIQPFIETFAIDATEFLDPVSSFRSFNDFFIRRLKPEARPIAADADAIIPADGRYYFYPNIAHSEGFIVKGKKFNLEELLGNASLAQTYREGCMVLARLCPTDYHRFHFPCDCVPGPTHLINGWLASVNPIAVKKNVNILAQNKRTLCELQTVAFGRVLYLEVGATNVGSIRETYTPGQWQAKGAEKGYFEFGGSALILLFPKDSLAFEPDLLAATAQGLEIRCLMGQRMGKRLADNPSNR